MPDESNPAITSRAETERLARRQREAQALRDNLRRRKAQTRSRADQTNDPRNEAGSLPPDRPPG